MGKSQTDVSTTVATADVGITDVFYICWELLAKVYIVINRIRLIIQGDVNLGNEADYDMPSAVYIPGAQLGYTASAIDDDGSSKVSQVFTTGCAHLQEPVL